MSDQPHDQHTDPPDPAPPDPDESSRATDGCPPTATSCLLAGVRVTFLGATALGLAEYTAARALFRKEVSGQAFPLSTELAAAGKLTTTYGVAFLLPMLLAGLAYFALRGRRPTATPEPFLATLFAILVAVLILPADLAMAGRATLAIVIPSVLVVLYLAAMVYVGLRLVRKWYGRCTLRRLTRRTATAAALLWLALAATFWRSPLRSPATYRAAPPPATAANTERPDVLWIVLDTARADRMSVYGYDKPTTPRLEALAADALVFDRAISNGVWTVPTHAAMFTGRPIREHGLGRIAPALQPEHRTVAELLAEAGYATGCFTNNPLVSPKTTLARGFADNFNVFTWLRSVRFSFEHLFEASGVRPPLSWFDQDYGAAVTNQLVSNWLARNADGPVFAFVNLMEVHLPYRVPSSYRRQFMSDEALGRSYALRRSVHGELEEWLHNTAIIDGYDDMPAVDRQAIIGQYDAGMRYLDDRIAELLDLFEAAGRLDNTLVIITSDHGEYLDTHGMWSHHFLTYQDVVHIPLIIQGPGVPRGQRRANPVQLTDLAPTVLAATLGDRAIPEDLRGRNLLAEMQAAVVTPAIAEHYGAGKKYDDRLLAKRDRALRHRAARQLALVESRYKYIWSSDGMHELYDLLADPTEQNNLARSMPLEARRMQQLIDQWKARTPELKQSDLRKPDWSPEVLRDLEALGYVGDE